MPSPARIAGARRHSDKPTLIACKTIIGYGAPTKQGKASTHGEPLGADEIKGAREKLGWAHRALRGARRRAGGLARSRRARGSAQRKAWEQRWRPSSTRAARAARRSGRRRAHEAIAAAIAEIKAEFAATPPKIATRVCLAEGAGEAGAGRCPSLIGGSADLTGSNGTRTKHHTPVAPGNYAGNYIHYGVREHAMAAAMNGLALHGGIVPYGGTFLVFTDYCRPSIRLSALMGQRVIYVMTHDFDRPRRGRPDAPAGRASGGPARHAEPQRVPPGRRGRDGRMLGAGAASTRSTPSILALTRQAVPALRTQAAARTCRAKGAYVLARGRRAASATSRILATGSEVGLAMEAREQLAKDGVQAAVVSMPCWELFARAARCLSRGGAGLGAAHRRRGRRRHGLGALAAATAACSSA